MLARWRACLAYLMFVFLLAGPCPPALATDDASQGIIGVWKLTAYSRHDAETGKEVRQFGEHPSGYITYLPNGRMMTVIVGDNRQSPASQTLTDAERITLFKTIIAAYAGTYSVSGNKVVHRVDVSWNQAWTGTEQVRYFTIDGKALTIQNPPRKSETTGATVFSTLTFEKVE